MLSRRFYIYIYVLFEAPDLDDESVVDGMIRDAICHMDKSKSAGSDGFARGHQDKGDFLTHDMLLIVRKVAAQIEVLKYGDVDEAIAQSAMVGSSTSEEGLIRMRQILERRGEKGEGVVRTSDVIGLDWSVGALGGSHGFKTILSALTPDPKYVSAVTACTWASYNSVYQIGRNL